MTKRTTTLFLTVALMGGCASSLLAQRDQIARLPNGKPDLSGTFNAATLTPLERPRELADKPFLTVEEAKALQEQERDFAANANRVTDADREAPPEGGAAVVGFEETADGGNRFGAGNVGGYNWFWVDRGSEAFAVDGQFPTSIVIDPPDGRVPPLTEEARKERMALGGRRRPNDGTAWWLDVADMHGPYDGPEDLGISERCLTGFTGATPTFPSLYNNYKRIVQTEDHVMILIEMVHDARVVRMSSEHPPADQKFWLGDSIGWWEGDTLVVESTNFRADGARRGSENMKVIERFTPQVGGDVVYNFTIDDPATYTAPWSGEYLWKGSDERVWEYACHEGNYAMRGIMKGARLLEAEKRGEPLPVSEE